MMGSHSHLMNFIVFSPDKHLEQKLERSLRQSALPATLTVARDLGALRRATAKRSFDGLILETKRGESFDFAKLQECVDPLRTVILAGSREALLQGWRSLCSPSHTSPADLGASPSGSLANGSLDGYVEAKLGDFVNGMKHGSARNLHPMLIKAVERPLILHALKVTNGNQIKTAHLLGMNRNTLRKKIADLRIPILRERRR